MLMSSVYFMLGFPALLFVYYNIPQKAKNVLLLLVSCALFLYGGLVYGLFLLFSICTTYLCGIHLAKTKSKRLTLAVTVFANLVVFVFFKYFNVFPINVLESLGRFGFGYNSTALRLFAPLGISYYTLQSIGYIADVYTGKIQPEKNFFVYALFACFFPYTIMGPISRAGKIIPQLNTPRPFVYADVTDGLRRMALGFFKKFAVADVLAVYINTAYRDIVGKEGLILFVLSLLFTFQLYADFSGYSDIAIGCAKTLGITLDENFKTPLFSTSVNTFWNRWHIGLSSWLRDYVYIPLGGSRRGNFRRYLNIAIVFIVSGIWHGDTWGYFVWGCINAIGCIAELVLFPSNKKDKNALVSKEPFILTAVKTFYTFMFFNLSLIVFKTASARSAFDYAVRMLLGHGTVPVHTQLYSFVLEGFDNTPIIAYSFIAFSIFTFALFIISEWYTCFKLKGESLATAIGNLKPVPRWLCYYALVAIILAAFLMQSGGLGDSSAFIYMQH